MNSLKIGVVGCGRIVQIAHLPALSTVPDVRVVALAEAHEGRLQDAARRVPGAATFVDYRQLLRDADVDAVVITLPPELHAEAAVAAFESDRHVYLEKPIATELRDAERVVTAWKRSGRVGMIGFNYRHHPLYLAARTQVRDGRMGDLVAVRTTFASAARTLPQWKQSRRTGGGALMELASHHLDLVRFIFEEPVVEVAAFARSQHTEADTVSVHQRLRSGLLVTSLCSITAVAEDTFEIYGRGGKLAVDRYEGSLVLTPPRHDDGRVPRLMRALRRSAAGVARVLRTPGEASHGLALRAFARAIRDGTSPAPDLDDGYRSLAVVAASERSIDEGRVVPLAAEDVQPHAPLSGP